MNRRELVSGIGALGVTGLAGCSNGGQESDTPTSEPEPPSRSERDETTVVPESSSPIYDSPLGATAVENHLAQVPEAFSVNLGLIKQTPRRNTRYSIQLAIDSDRSCFIRFELQDADPVNEYYRTSNGISYLRTFSRDVGTRYQSSGCSYTDVDFASQYGLTGEDVVFLENTGEETSESHVLTPKISNLIENVTYTYSQTREDAPGGGVTEPITRDFYTAESYQLFDSEYIRRFGNLGSDTRADSVISVRKNGLIQGVYVGLRNDNISYIAQGSFAGTGTVAKPDWLEEAKFAVDGSKC